MQLIETSLDKVSETPYLFYGPSQTGKKTMLANKLRSKKFHVQTMSLDEAEGRAPLAARSLHGPIAYVIQIDHARTVSTLVPGTLVVYVCRDPYLLGTTEQLKGKFTLVDLTNQLHHHVNPVMERFSFGRPDEDNQKKPPWVALGILCDKKSSYSKKLETIEGNPSLIENLFINTNYRAYTESPVEAAETTWKLAEKLSSLDRSFYIDSNGDHTNLMECLAITSTLKMNGRERLNWKRAGVPMRFFRGKRSRDAIYHITPPGEKSPLLKMKRNKQNSDNPAKRAVLQDQTAKRVRTAPNCKACKVPLKGHKCPNKVKVY